MNKPKKNQKPVRDPLKKLSRASYRRAFGQPSAEFHERVRDTLFLIEEKEDAPVKKKMTFSMAFALVMCICLVTAAFAGSLFTNNIPDNTFDPLSQAQNSAAPTLTPMPSPMPVASDPLYYRSGDMGFYHKLFKCFGGEQYILTTQEDIDRLNLTACPYCVFDTVYCMEGSVLYHKTADCTAFGEHSLAATMFDAAKSEGKTACPICIASSCIFWQEGNEYPAYHLRICSEMDKIADHSGAVQGTVAEARACGRKLCETCKNSAVLYSPNDPYMSHWDKQCMDDRLGMDAANAEWIPFDSALSIDASGCALCMENLYFCTPWNEFYHRYHDCSAINGSSLMLLSEEDAVSSGRTLCPDCNIRFTPPPTIPNKVMPTATPMSAAPTPFSMPTATPNIGAATPDTVTVYVDDGGSHYHTDYKCSGMTNPKKWQEYSLAQAMNMGRTACPVCLHFSAATATPMPTATPIAFEPRTVYFVENGGVHYHTDYACSGMKNPQFGTVAQALNLGKTACPVCMNVSPTPMPMKDSELVYMTDYNGIYYHYDENCMNMTHAYYTTFDAMRNGDDRPPCPLCVINSTVKEEPQFIWSAEGDIYYHIDNSCGSRGKTRMTLAVAENRRQLPCPTCLSDHVENEYYYRADGTFYHADRNCRITENCELLSGSLMQVQALGRTPCPNCYEPSSSDITYYGTPSARSYHTQFSCASMEEYLASGNWYDRGEIALSFEEILANAPLQPCADCVQNELTTSAMMRSDDDTVPLMLDAPLAAPGEIPTSLVVNAMDFRSDSIGSVMDSDVNWDNDILTIHSTIMMHSRGALYTEFEFTLKDPTVHPGTVRIIPYGEQHGSLDCIWANVQTVTYDNGDIGYLLCQMMLSPSPEYDADRFLLYSGDRLIAEFK